MKNKLFLITFSICIQSLCAQTLNWGAYINTQNKWSASDVVIDTNGNTYTVGLFVNSADFNPGPGVFGIAESNPNVGNYYCVKLDPQGNFVWAMPVGGTNNINTVIGGYVPKISIDNNAGAIYITGGYSSEVDFDPSPATYLIPPPPGGFPNGEYNFAAKYTLSGNLVWAKYLTDNDGIDMIGNAVDNSGDVYIISNFAYGTHDVDPGPDIFNVSTTPGGRDFYILKLNSDGEFIWAKQFGDPTKLDIIRDIVIDGEDNIIITGLFSGLVDFDPSPTTNNLQSNNDSNDAFIAKYNSDGEYIWAKSFGSINTGVETGRAITVDDQNNIYAAGTFSGLTDFDPSANVFNLSPVGGRSIYILKLTSSGDFDFVKTIGSANMNADLAYDIAVDNAGSLYVTGYYVLSMDCDPDAGVFTITANGGNNEIFLVSLSASAGQFGWAKSIGGTGYDEGKGIAIHEMTNRLTLVGQFEKGSNVDFDPPNGYYFSTVNTGNATFIINYSLSNLANDDFSYNNGLVIYPNPAVDLISIETNADINSYQLVDITGKILLTKYNSKTVDVSNITPGIYILKVKSNERTYSKKVVIQ